MNLGNPARREVLGALTSEIDAICNVRLLDPTLSDRFTVEQRARAQELEALLTPEQRNLLELGGTARRWVISTPDKDRHRSVFLSDSWDLRAYQSNPVIMFNHDYRALPIGLSNGAEVGIDGKLRSVGVLLPAAESEIAGRVDRLIELKVLRSASIGAVASEVAFVEDDKGDWWVEYRKVELVEWSVVNIPSNRSSTVEAARMAHAEGMSAADARDFLTSVSRQGVNESDEDVVSDVAGAGSDPWALYRPLIK